MKRAFDLTLSLLGCPIALPLIGIVAVIIKLTSPGPVFFFQTRIGLHGRTFRMCKFRTMVIDAEKLGGHFTQRNDPRITPIGRVLRRTKLDELPQLFNVISGDMSLVGPRPDTPKRVNQYTPEMRRILQVRPGITGIASLYLRDEEKLFDVTGGDPDEFYIKVIAPAKIKIAMAHVDNNSWLFDLKILLQTAWSLTLGRLFPSQKHPIIEELLQAGRHYARTNADIL